MTRAEMISQLLDIAYKTCRAYFADSRHDVRLLAQAEPGDLFLWRPYESGTHILSVKRGAKPNQKAAHLFHVMQSVNRSAGYTEGGWRLITIGQIDCGITEIDAGEAASIAWEALREAETPGVESVSEFYL